MSYVPPHLRKRQAENEKEPPLKSERAELATEDDDLVSLEEVRNYFWPLDASHGRFASDTLNKTLHDAAASPQKLAYLFLFHGANPRWDTDNIIYTKSRLELLPQQFANDPDEHNGGLSKDGQEPAVEGAAEQHASVSGHATTDSSNGKPHSGPIAVFQQIRSTKSNNARNFAFEGWFKIERVAFLEPHSQELVRMLQQKWQKTDKYGKVIQRQRDESAWKASLSQRWAVIKFAKDDQAERDRGEPKIERMEHYEEETKPKKTVNEMLAEMRLGGEKKVELATDAADTEFLDKL